MGVASSLTTVTAELAHLGLRLAYAVLIGWWFSALTLLAGWVLVLSIVGIPLARRLYYQVPRLETLATYDSDVREPPEMHS